MFKSLKKLIKNLLIHTQNIPDFVAFAFYFKRGVNLYLYSFIKNRVIAMSQLRNCIISQLFNSFILFHSMGCGLLSPLVPRGGNWAVLLLAHGHAQAPPGGNPPPGQVVLNTALCWCPPPPAPRHQGAGINTEAVYFLPEGFSDGSVPRAVCNRHPETLSWSDVGRTCLSHLQPH